MNQHVKQSRQRWKMSAHEVMAAPMLIPGSDWHPLDGVPAPEYIPETWSGPHVGVRMVEGFKTLMNLPSAGARSTASGYWPETWATWEDLLAQTTADVATQEMDAAEKNRVRVRPTAQDVSRMEAVIVWPARYLALRWLSLARTVQSVALLRAREFDLEMIARKLRRGSKELRFANRDGLDLIARGLRQDGALVF